MAKFIEEDTPGFHQVERISLVSSFVATLFLAGPTYSPVDAGDASGMNLMVFHHPSGVYVFPLVSLKAGPITSFRTFVPKNGSFPLLKLLPGRPKELKF